MKKNSFRDSLVNLADDLAHEVYHLTYNFPREEKYALGDQLRRAIISVPTNIIEGIARGGEKEKARFMNIAYASLKEAKYLISFSYKEKMVSDKKYQKVYSMAEDLSKLLFSFIKLLRKDV